MKKKLSIILLIIMCLFLWGCDSQEKNDTNSKKDASSTTAIETHKTDQEKQTKYDTSSSKTQSDKKDTQSKKSDTKKQDNSNKEIFFGNWVIKKQLAALGVQSLSTEDINSIIGKEVTFSKETSISFREQASDLDNIINNPIYTKKIISKDDFEKENKSHVTFEKLGVKGDSITEIDVTDSKQNTCCTFYIKDNNRLILSGGGVFF